MPHGDQLCRLICNQGYYLRIAGLRLDTRAIIFSRRSMYAQKAGTIFQLDPLGHVATWNPGAQRIKRSPRIRLRRSAGDAPSRGCAEGATGVGHASMRPWVVRAQRSAAFSAMITNDQIG